MFLLLPVNKSSVSEENVCDSLLIWKPKAAVLMEAYSSFLPLPHVITGCSYSSYFYYTIMSWAKLTHKFGHGGVHYGFSWLALEENSVAPPSVLRKLHFNCVCMFIPKGPHHLQIEAVRAGGAHMADKNMRLFWCQNIKLWGFVFPCVFVSP